MAVYPDPIAAALEGIAHSGDLPTANARGRAVNFGCGGFVEISLAISDEKGMVDGARFRTNGCGYLTAAADLLCSGIAGKELADLHGLDDLKGELRSRLAAPPRERVECFASAVEALKGAFRDHRERRVEEFAGEKALICTCFGVSEDTILRYIEDGKAATVDEISASLRAGSGCGSCRMLIQELVDSAGI
jgi:NifU-like protein